MSENEQESERRRRKGRRSRSAGSRRSGSKKRERIQDRANRVLTVSISICIALILIVAAYFHGRHVGMQRMLEYVRNKAPQTAAAVVPVTPPQENGEDFVLDESEWEEIARIRNMALKAQGSGNIERAAILLAQLSEKYPMIGEIFLARARIEWQRNDFTVAQSLADAAEGRGASTDRVNIERGKALMQAGQNAAAVDFFENAARDNPMNPYAYFHWGEALRKEGRAQAATEKLENAHLLAEHVTDAFFIEMKWRLAQLESGIGNPVEFIDERLAETPDAPLWLILGAVVDLQERRVKEAEAKLEHARERLPEPLFRYAMQDSAFDYYRIEGVLPELLETED